jgi:hypothetical protein
MIQYDQISSHINVNFLNLSSVSHEYVTLRSWTDAGFWSGGNYRIVIVYRVQIH